MALWFLVGFVFQIPLMSAECENEHLAIITYIRSMMRAAHTHQLYLLWNCYGKCCVTWIMWFLWHCVCLVEGGCYIAVATATAIVTVSAVWIELRGCDGILYLLFSNGKAFLRSSPFLCLRCKNCRNLSLDSFFFPFSQSRPSLFVSLFFSLSPFLCIIGSTRSGVIVRKQRWKCDWL